MSTITLAVRLQFSQEDFDMAHALMRKMIPGTRIPTEPFIGDTPIPINFSGLDPQQSVNMCAGMLFSMYEAVENQKENPST